MITKEIKDSLVICLAVTTLILFLGANNFKAGDYDYHFNKSKNGCDNSFFENKNLKRACEEYAPLFHILAKPFTFNQNAFFYFTIILFLIISPLIILDHTKNYFSVLLYFTASDYIFYFMDGIFPQALANILLFLLFFTKDSRVEVGLLPILIVTHGSAFIAGIIILLLKKIDIEAFFCSSIFLNQKPEILYQKLGSVGGIDFRLSNIIYFFSRIFPLPFFLIALKQTWETNKKYFSLIIILFIAGFFYASRVWYLSFLLSIPAITMFYEKQNTLGKIALILSCFIFFTINVVLFNRLKTLC